MKIVVRPGDTLSRIALERFGDAARWRQLFALNGEAIIAAQGARGLRLAAAEQPHWIFPGLVLELPPARPGAPL